MWHAHFLVKSMRIFLPMWKTNYRYWIYLHITNTVRTYTCNYLSKNQLTVQATNYTKLIIHKIFKECKIFGNDKLICYIILVNQTQWCGFVQIIMLDMYMMASYYFYRNVSNVSAQQ